MTKNKFYILTLIFISIFTFSCSFEPLIIYVPLLQNFNLRIDGPLSYKFKNVQFLCENTVELNMIINQFSNISYIYDKSANGILDHSTSDLLDHTLKNFNYNIISNCRFSYLISYKNSYYIIGNIDSNLFLWKSYDLINWNMINEQKPILTNVPNTIWENMWNCAFDVDENDIWHIYVECGETYSNQLDVGLGYSWGVLSNDNIDFNKNKHNNIKLKNAGNPYIKIKNKDILLCYGNIYKNDAIYSNNWYVSFGISSITNSKVEDKSSLLKLGNPGFDICDPHMIEINGKIKISFSYSQLHTFLIESEFNYSNLIDILKN